MDLRVGFQGRYHDAVTELMYYRNRNYHNRLGRFISRDPMGVWYDDLAYGNGYVSFALNPLRFFDKFGTNGELTKAEKRRVAGHVYGETSSLRPKWKKKAKEKEKKTVDDYDPESERELEKARRRIAGVSKEDPERVADPKIPSDEDLNNENIKREWMNALNAAENFIDPESCRHFVIWCSNDEGHIPAPGMGSNWPYSQKDKIKYSYGPFRNVLNYPEDHPCCNKDFYIFFYCGVK